MESLLDKTNHTNRGFLDNFILAAVAFSIGKTCTSPLNQLKLNIATVPIGKKTLLQNIQSNWKGNFTLIKRIAPSQSFLFSLNYYLKQIINFDKLKTERSIFFSNFCIGSLAGAINTIIFYPIDIARATLYQSKIKSENIANLREAFNSIYQKNGIKGLYHGFNLSIFGIMMYRGCFFGLFDTALMLNPEKSKYNIVKNTSFAYLCCLITGFICYPIDTVRRYLMFDRSNYYLSFYDCFIKIVKDQSFFALFKGVNSIVINSISPAIMLSTFHLFKHWKIHIIQ